jgi:ERCC4-type nuclease
MPPKPILIIDTREKIPWDYDGDDSFAEIKSKKLDVGDYSIEGMEDIIVIERKAGADELYNNFGQKGGKRIYAEIDRMKDHKIKIIIVEQTLEEILDPESYYVNISGKNRFSKRMPPAVVASNLNELMLKHGVQVIFAGFKAQATAKNLLLKAYELHRKGKL